MDAFGFFFIWTLIAFSAGAIIHWLSTRRRMKRYRQRIKALERVLGLPPQ
jgi:hypothetical protein